MCSVVSDQV